MLPTLLQLGLTDRPAIAEARRCAGGERALAARLLAMLAADGAPGIVLSTCERLEVYTLARPGSAHGPAACAAALARIGCPARRVGLAAVEHLFRTAAGLESRLLGEAHILGQVGRAAVDGATGLDDSPVLRRLFEAAVAGARSVRARTGIGSAGPSYAAAACAAVERWHAGASGGPCEIGVLGSGSLALEASALLRSSGAAGGVVLMARHHERARGLIADPAVCVAPLSELRARLDGLGCVVAAAGAAEYLLTADDLHGCAEPRLLIDLGVPANIDPACAAITGVCLMTLDDMAGPGEAPSARAARDAHEAGAQSARAAERWARRWLIDPDRAGATRARRVPAPAGGAA